MSEITMPRLSDTMEEGTIASWLKKPGEQVNRGEVIAQIETDKATMDLTAFESGTLQEILVPEGQTVAIGQAVARIGSGAAPSKAEESAPESEAAASPATEDSEPSSTDEAEPPSTEASEPPAAEETGSEAPRTPEARENVAEAPEPSAPPSEQPTLRADTEPASSDGATENDKVRASPMARHIASEHGLDLSNIHGSGPQGRVIRADVEAALKSPSQPAPPAQDGAAQPAPAQEAAAQPAQAPQQDGDGRVPLSQMRRTIARRMAESTRTIPHFFLTTTIDATDLVALRKQLLAEMGDNGPRISINDMVVKAAAIALRRVSEVNVSFAEDSLIEHTHVNIGVAVATERGLIVPVVRDVDQKSLGVIAREARTLAEKAHAGKLQPKDYAGGTFTVSNLGMFGVEQFNAVINPPEAAILAVGAVTREPAERDGNIVLRDRLALTLSVDHRALDGAIGARYLQALKQLLEKPMLLLV
ncbi:MAG: 2-oxo acid dehydrogenase subunit E2 [Chloroflexi bacterium]|nr:2-oxo acid dehydrogenase subunit E2 [Chloroflexota bacterium]